MQDHKDKLEEEAKEFEDEMNAEKKREERKSRRTYAQLKKVRAVAGDDPSESRKVLYSEDY